MSLCKFSFLVEFLNGFEIFLPNEAAKSLSGVRRIFQWGDSVTSHRDDVKMLQLAYSSSEVLKCIGL